MGLFFYPIMKISKRLLYYIIGFGLGIILTAVIFIDKDIFGFMPTNRVLRDIQESNIMISPLEKERLDCMGIDEAFIFKMIEEADVNFSTSQTAFSDEKFIWNGLERTVEVKKYELEYKDKLLSFWIAPKDSISILHTINPGNCNTTSTDTKHLNILYMPEALIFSKLKAKDLWLNKNIKCQMECLNILQSDIVELFKSGNILIKESFPGRKPNPVYFIKQTINDSDWIFWVELGDTKTRIKYIINVTGLTLEPDQFLINQLFQQVQEEDACNCYK